MSLRFAQSAFRQFLCNLLKEVVVGVYPRKINLQLDHVFRISSFRGKRIVKKMYKKNILAYLRKIAFLLVIVLLTSCDSPAETAFELTLNIVSDFMPTETSTPLPPTATLFSAPTITPTATLVPLPVKTPLPSEPLNLERFRIVYVEDGNIFLQDGTNPPIQLTESGIDRFPIISDDGEKIVFYRGEEDDNVYSINADGSNEQLIIKSENLPALGQGKIKALTFIPDKHSMLFNTFICNPREFLYNAPDCSVGIYWVDTDSGEIRHALVGLHGNPMQDRNFQISPDGNYLAVANSGHIDIYFFRNFFRNDLSGDYMYLDAISYHRTLPDEFLPKMYWLPDSSGMIVIVATSRYNEPATPPHTYTAFRYTLTDNKVETITLDATIMHYWGCNFSVSPNRSWILFMGNETGDRREMPFVYLANLNNGHTQRYEGGSICPSFYYSTPKWSPDSRYFASYGSMNPTRTIGDVEGGAISFGGELIQWLDVSHYLYHTRDGKELLIGELGGESVPLPEGFRWSSDFVIMTAETEE